MLSPHAHYTDMAQRRELYRQELEAHGYTMAGRDLPMARLIAVAETDRAAEDIARRGAPPGSWTLTSIPPRPPTTAAYLTSQRGGSSEGRVIPLHITWTALPCTARQSG